jgi:hypothetical protein
MTQCVSQQMADAFAAYAPLSIPPCHPGVGRCHLSIPSGGDTNVQTRLEERVCVSTLRRVNTVF